MAAGGAALLLAACTSGDPAIPSGPSGSVAPPSARFPISVTRIGGTENFDDSLTISGSGTVETVSKGVTTSCRLDAEHPEPAGQCRQLDHR